MSSMLTRRKLLANQHHLDCCDAHSTSELGHFQPEILRAATHFAAG
jgi:hypothetical protein